MTRPLFWYGQQDVERPRSARDKLHRGDCSCIRNGNLNSFFIYRYPHKNEGVAMLPLGFWYGQQDLNLHSKESDPKSDASANSAMPAEWSSVKYGRKRKGRVKHYMVFNSLSLGGGGGIRTHGRFYSPLDFESRPL